MPLFCYNCNHQTQRLVVVDNREDSLVPRCAVCASDFVEDLSQQQTESVARPESIAPAAAVIRDTTPVCESSSISASVANATSSQARSAGSHVPSNSASQERSTSGLDILMHFISQMPSGMYRLIDDAVDAFIVAPLNRTAAQPTRSHAKPPASAEAIASLEVVAVDEASNLTSTSCSICLNSLEIGEECVRMKCAHVYHRDCLTSWLRTTNTCPDCRFEVESCDPKYERRRPSPTVAPSVCTTPATMATATATVGMASPALVEAISSSASAE
jgi:hypothetical protein